MKYLFVYSYNGISNGKPVNGTGSCNMTATGEDKITPKVIASALEWVKKDMIAKGFRIDAIAPMGWFKYDGYDE